MLPRAANLATLAVVVAATWWSGAQRPAIQPQIGATPTRVVAQGNTPAAPEAAATANLATTATTPGTSAALWPATAATIARDGLQAVSFQSRPQR